MQILAALFNKRNCKQPTPSVGSPVKPSIPARDAPETTRLYLCYPFYLYSRAPFIPG